MYRLATLHDASKLLHQQTLHHYNRRFNGRFQRKPGLASTHFLG